MGRAPKVRSHQTLRWSKRDSNPRSFRAREGRSQSREECESRKRSVRSACR